MVTSEKSPRWQAATSLPGGALHALVSRLAEIDLDAAPAAAVETLLRTAQIDDKSLAPFLYFAPGRYTRNCVYRDERFELLVLCWADGSRSPIHDHGGSRCFVKVQRGSLSVENYSVVENGDAPGHARLERADTQIVSVGDIDVRNPARDVHRVASFGGPAISLHVYAKPLDRCLVFDRARQSCRIARNGYDTRPGRR